MNPFMPYTPFVIDVLSIPGRGTVVVTDLGCNPVSAGDELIFDGKTFKIFGVERASSTDRVGLRLGDQIAAGEILKGTYLNIEHKAHNDADMCEHCLGGTRLPCAMESVIGIVYYSVQEFRKRNKEPKEVVIGTEIAKELGAGLVGVYTLPARVSDENGKYTVSVV